MNRLSAAGDVSGFGPLNEGMQSVVNEVIAQSRATLVPQIAQLMQDRVVPQVTSNAAMQTTIGQAAGTSMASSLKPYLLASLAALVVIAGASVWIATKE